MATQAPVVQHIGIPVSNMERSLTFYKEVLGFEVMFIAEGSGEGLSKAVNVPGADLKYAFLKAGNTVVELLQYNNPKPRPQDRMNCDVGACHVAFEVPDIDEAYRRLQAQQIRFYAPPTHIDEGPLKGCAFAYFPDPDGISLEIFQTAH